MYYEVDDLERRPLPRSNFLRNFLICSFLLSASLFFAYQKGLLPHYTLMIDGNKWEWVRDDPAHLASQPKPEMIQQESKNADYPQVIQDQSQNQPSSEVVNQTNDGQVKKCLNAAGRAVYQIEPCASTGLKPVKTLTKQDGNISAAYTHQYINDEQPEQQQTRPAVASLDQGTKRQTQECINLEYMRENIRARQRVNSTQWLRDEYDRLSKRWLSECLS